MDQAQDQPQNQDINFLDPIQNIEQILQEQEVSVSETESEASVKKLIGESEHWNVLLTKVGFALTLYHLLMFSAIILLLMNEYTAKQIYYSYYISSFFFAILPMIMVIKLSAGFFGSYFRDYCVYLYLIDLFLSSLFILGFYFYMQTALANNFNYYLPYLVIYSLNLFASSFVFTITSFFKNKVKRYNYFTGFALMGMTNIIIVMSIYIFWKTSVNTFIMIDYIIILMSMLFFDIFLSINAYQIVNYRTDKYYDDDTFYCYFAFTTDLFSFFIIDLLAHSVIISRRKRKYKEGKAASKGSKRKDREPSTNKNFRRGLSIDQQVS